MRYSCAIVRSHPISSLTLDSIMIGPIDSGVAMIPFLLVLTELVLREGMLVDVHVSLNGV